MKHLLILGAGTGGTLLANKFHAQLPTGWDVTVVDRDNKHHYQPGYLFIPFGMYRPKQVVKPRERYLREGITFVQDKATRIDRDHRQVALASGRNLPWDLLIIATGTAPKPSEIPGMADGSLWRKRVFDFYTLEGSAALAKALKGFKKGNLVVHISEMPIKCPVAPLEFCLLAQDFMRKRGRMWDVDITFVTPLDGPFTKPVASKKLDRFFAERGINVITDFQIASVDNDKRELTSYDGRTVPFDLLVTVPPNRGAQVVIDAGLGDDAGFIPVNKNTLQSEADPDIWVIGDATNAPTSKAGAVVHFEADSMVPNILAYLKGQPFKDDFDGHANCFIESGRGEAMLLDFNYEQEPVPGKFPLPIVGPLTLLAPTHINHWSKLAFEYVYWNLLIRGLPLPFPAHLTLAGKELERKDS